MTDWQFPVLISDVGGTNARFAVVPDAASPAIPLPAGTTEGYPSFEAAAKAALAGTGVTPKSCVLCAAGPVKGASVKLTNADWIIDGRQMARALNLKQGLILNDFEALALSIPSIRPDWVREIGHVEKPVHGARLVHGPGTGLGTAALIAVDGKWLAIASEGSHSDFAAVYPDEKLVWPHVEPKLGRLTPETLISGPGLRRLHRARLAATGRARPDIDDPEIVSRALANPGSDEGETVAMFWRLVARYAGDLALTFLATGGVFLAGGVLPRIAGSLNEAEFRRVFKNKAPYAEIVEQTPVSLLLKPDAVTQGMADIARRPELYAIDYAARAWS